MAVRLRQRALREWSGRPASQPWAVDELDELADALGDPVRIVEGDRMSRAGEQPVDGYQR
ncbi:hypothetical protein AB0H49_04325 [Nocardia sp. NPDC050713]|uniref:hypothetical protein n=1 Tax=Nocardia sp. NPDC050713 TaxID=3154511 RepID=UPI0033ED7B59